MRKNDLEAAPGPCRSHWSCTGPVHLQDGIRTQGPLGTGLLLTNPAECLALPAALWDDAAVPRNSAEILVPPGRREMCSGTHSKNKNTHRKKGLKIGTNPKSNQLIAIGTGLMLWQPDNWVLQAGVLLVTLGNSSDFNYKSGGTSDISVCTATLHLGSG